MVSTRRRRTGNASEVEGDDECTGDGPRGDVTALSTASAAAAAAGRRHARAGEGGIERIVEPWWSALQLEAELLVGDAGKREPVKRAHAVLGDRLTMRGRRVAHMPVETPVRKALVQGDH